MPKGKSFDEILSDAERLVRVWTANEDLALGDVTLISFQTQVAAWKTKRESVEALRTQLTRGVDEVNDQASAIRAINTRALSGARAQYGPDSAQYAQLGGTRASERKPRKKKTPKS
ncbi:MAG: hypothetical protein H7Z16_02515 [Pyrinomonadaceae bacterium]|nr:hypothetical protein [Pyrinomonadaceae bacterium]